MPKRVGMAQYPCQGETGQRRPPNSGLGGVASSSPATCAFRQQRPNGGVDPLLECLMKLLHILSTSFGRGRCISGVAFGSPLHRRCDTAELLRGAAVCCSQPVVAGELLLLASVVREDGPVDAEMELQTPLFRAKYCDVASGPGPKAIKVSNPFVTGQALQPSRERPRLPGALPIQECQELRSWATGPDPAILAGTRQHIQKDFPVADLPCPKKIPLSSCKLCNPALPCHQFAITPATPATLPRTSRQAYPGCIGATVAGVRKSRTDRVDHRVQGAP